MNWIPTALFLVSCAQLEAPGVFEEDKNMGPGGGGEGFGGMGAPASAPAPVASEAMDTPMEKSARAKGEVAMDGLVAADKDGEAAPTRSWFPETMLWTPLVETDASGRAEVPVRVPDSLTTWRILALGWSAAGAQGGATIEVPSTLPAYVDVVLPVSLYAGDELAAPVQLVNTTSSTLSGPLTVEVSGAVGRGGGSVAVPAGGSVIRATNLSTTRSGTVVVHASFGGVDSVERTVEVVPAGRRREESGVAAVGGAAVPIPAGAAGPDGELELEVWSGAVGVVVGELVGRRDPFAEGRAANDLADVAYRFALAVEGGKLDKVDIDPEVVRTTRIRSWVPLGRAGRAPDPGTACLLAEALRGTPEATREGELRLRMIEEVRRAQAPDGTWTQGLTTLDAALAQTAACARAGGDDAGLRLRAEGAFIRNITRLTDPYLAAWALASGAVVDADLRARLTETLTAALVLDQNGAHLPGGGVRGDGAPVSQAEATAVAALALHGDAQRAGALATGLLAERSAWGGWGDGYTNLLALRALADVFPGAGPQAAALTVRWNGEKVASGRVSGADGHRPVLLRAPWSGEAGSLEVAADSSAPGLVYAWRARSYGPWAPESSGAVALTVAGPASARVGGAVALSVSLDLPRNTVATLRVGLPAGVRPDPVGMDGLVAEGAFGAWEAAEGYVELRTMRDGGWQGALPVIPSLAGRLSSGPSRVFVGGEVVALQPPSRWSISP